MSPDSSMHSDSDASSPYSHPEQQQQQQRQQHHQQQHHHHQHTSSLAATTQDPADAAGTAAPPFSSTSLPPIAPSHPTHASPAPSSAIASGLSTTPHKRGREPSSMTDPIEAARYTPPREMFRHSSAVTDSDDLISLPSEDSLLESELDLQMETSSHIRHEPSQNMANGYPADSELDNLGQQLSIHSPEKSVHAPMDQERALFGRNSPRHGSGAERDASDSEHGDENQGQEQDQELQSPPPPYDQQHSTIMSLKHTRLEEGDPWFLVNNLWFANFRKYCTKMSRGGEAEHPGQIDNSLLLSGDSLKPDVQNAVTLLPQEAWELLVSWYGTMTAPIQRYVINTGSSIAPNLMVDFYPPVFNLYRVVETGSASNMMFAMNEPDTLEVPRSTKFGDLKSALLSRMGATNSGAARLWAIPTHATLSIVGNTIEADVIMPSGATCLEGVDEEAAVAEVPELTHCKDLALELEIDGAYPVMYQPSMPTLEPSVSFALPRNMHGSRSIAMASQGQAVNGLCGLSNLGNTCFMNSALQCLSNTPDLTRYFLAGAWRDELNLDNPLGMEGEVARAYANLMDKVWKGTSSVFSPREFKMTIGRFAPSFTGYHQHDSQELLAFLLDGLHEDLNRIIKKPYTEVPDSNGRPDEEVASDCWEIHKARNDSIIVDLFQGQYKSTLVCPECEKVSVTFDPFMYLSLPLPINKKWVGTVTYVPYDPRAPVVDIRLQLPKGSTQRQLKERIAEMMGTQANQLFSAEVFSHRFYKSHDNADAVDELGESDKNFVYEFPIPDFLNAPDHVVFPVFSMMEPTATYGRPATCGHPMMVCVTKEEALNPDAVYRAIAHQASRYTTMDLFEDDSLGEENGPEIAVEDEDGQDDMDTRADTSAERLPKSGLFQMSVYSPPVVPPPRYHHRSMSRATLYAPSTVPSLSEMEDMYLRVAPKESETMQELGSFTAYTSNSNGTLLDDDDSDIQQDNTVFVRAGSPSTPSDSSRSSSRPRAPLPDEDELSEEDDPATLKLGPKFGKEVVPQFEQVHVSEPAVRPGEMVYCIWDRSMETAICMPERRYRSMSSYRSMDEEENQESADKALWDERGPLVMDPALAEELSTAKKGKKTITLEDCLNEYTREEQLGEEDLWYCPSCKKHQQATKKLDIWRLPDILVVHLKRFSHTRAWRDKIDALVDFPIHGLDLSGKALKEEDREANVYDLFGVSNHMGGLGGGHYTAYAKNEKLDQWYNFDDSHVSPVANVESIKSPSAYLLFYRRRNAVVREYEQRAAEEVPTVGSSTDTHGGYMLSMGGRSLRESKTDDEEEYGWGNPPAGPFQDMQTIHGMDDSDADDLPSYSPMIGPSEMAGSSSSSFTGGPTFMGGPSHGKMRLVDEDEDADAEDSGTTAILSTYDDDSRDTVLGHSPDLSTCASDGSNPGTANVSPALAPSSSISGYPLLGQPLLSGISQEGGRIDDSDAMEDAGEGSTGGAMYAYGGVGTGAGIPTPTPEGGDETEGDEGERDGVNLVGWQETSSSG
ncbi:CSN-associated deubiquitinating enzyme Ubp12 [Mortierella alpina]|uniref:ubiquitinyl hydrolase 1 n=1 Tax=Mortierella alpina TaxID=64518 RepID=A0A9P6JEL1_MORAP|nr:CSN-associated deubiquitinating enzyme Ubp12 [Mortierella alpina]